MHKVKVSVQVINHVLSSPWSQKSNAMEKQIYKAQENKGRGQKKTGFCVENSQTGGGLTQTHSIFFSIFSNSGAY